MMAAIRLLIAGRVQGVGYRNWLTHLALHNDLKGWVRNRSTGEVEALLMGEQNAVEKVIDYCWTGPTFASVIAIDRQKVEPDGSQAFSQRPTI